MVLPRILIVEDGQEYITAYQRFLGDRFAFRRAGDGDAAWSALSDGDVDAVVLDMRFDRADRRGGTPRPSRSASATLAGPSALPKEDHQGTFILAGLRDRGCRLPVVLSYDFGPAKEALRTSGAPVCAAPLAGRRRRPVRDRRDP